MEGMCRGPGGSHGRQRRRRGCPRSVKGLRSSWLLWALTSFRLAGCCRGSQSPGCKGYVCSGMCTLVKRRGVPSSLLRHIYFSSQMFIVKLEISPLSSSQPHFLQASRALSLFGVFDSNFGFSRTSVYFRTTFSLSCSPPAPNPPPSQTPSPSRHHLQFRRALHLP